MSMYPDQTVNRGGRPRVPGGPTDRGYGRKHRELRASWHSRIQGGEVVFCWYPDCGKQIKPTMAWHLSHHEDRSLPAEPAHRQCNLYAAKVAVGPKRAAALAGTPMPPPRSAPVVTAPVAGPSQPIAVAAARPAPKVTHDDTVWHRVLDGYADRPEMWFGLLTRRGMSMADAEALIERKLAS